ncbi:MAG TPA: hypothetical protein VK348_01995, partial [Planctomycetota bacterium]|nr:hypothetical protein [Planctomycetota bacterium]
RKQNVLVRAADGSRTLVPTITADDPRWLVAEQERLAEDLRLAYVGVTRARRRCYVYFGGLNGAQHSSLAWLLLGATDLSDANWPTRWTSQLLDSVRGWRDVLQRFVGASGGTMSLTDVPEQPLPGRIADAAAPRLQSVRAMPARLPRPWQMHSFTSLTAFASEAAGETDFTAAIPDHFDPPAGAAAGIAEGIFAFARGAHAGQCLHEILEHADLALPEPQTRTLVTTTLRRHGLHEPAAHAGMIAPVDTVLAMLRDLAGARSTLADAALVEVCAGARMAEWQFCLAAGDAPLRALAAVFERHAAPALAAYAARLAELPARTLHGFLSGFADLVTEYRGRYFLFDWKSNHLGDRADDYGPAALRDSMFAHDYVLQYHLYVLALHRHLRVRLSGYDYDRHFGGVCYPYLRGVRAGTATGLFTDRPPRALIVAMDRWLGGEAAR